MQQHFARMLQRAGQTARRLAQQTSLTSLKQWGEGLQQPVTSVVAEKMPSWIMLGPPGVGKGTYSSRVAKLLGISHISAGDLVRDEIKNQTECGQQARGLACRGRPGGAVSCNADWDCEIHGAKGSLCARQSCGISFPAAQVASLLLRLVKTAECASARLARQC